MNDEEQITKNMNTPNDPLNVSVIISTHNDPVSLSLVLQSLCRQTYPHFEVLVAEDGEQNETKEVISYFQSAAPYPLRHFDRPYSGFQKYHALNTAASHAEGTYFVFLDGDCMVRSRHIEAHLRYADPSRYVAGGKVMLNQSTTTKFSAQRISRGALDRFGFWWFGCRRKQRLFLSLIPGLSKRLDKRHPYAFSWRGENGSLFAQAFFDINGFDQRFTYGYGDKDFGQRLRTHGLTSCSIRYQEPVFHLYHDRPYIKPGMQEKNHQLYLENQNNQCTRTPYGMNDFT